MTYKSKLLNEVIATNNLSSNKSSLDTSPGISVLMVDPETEPVIQIDSDLRTINIPEELRDIAVTGDHKSETIYFSCPRFFDGNDLSEHKCLIRFVNAGNEYGESEVVDMTANDDNLEFGWAIKNDATRYSGTLQFTVQFETVQNGIQYQWQTTPAILNILPGLPIETTISANNDILFRTLTNQITNLQARVEALEESIANLSSLSSDLKQLKDDVAYLKENVVYVLTT